MKRMRTAAALIAALLLCFALAGCGSDEGYLASLDESGIFANKAGQEIPQTAVHDIVMQHFAAPLPAGKTAKYCCVIGLDGVRADAMTLLDEGGGIRSVAATGGLYLSLSGGDDAHKQATNTAPSWASILTGVWSDSHGVTRNYQEKSADCPTFLTELAETRGIPGMLAFGWDGHLGSIGTTTYGPERDADAAAGLPVEFLDFDDDEAIAAAMIAEAKDPAGAQILFCVLDDTDSAGESGGFGIDKPKYQAEVLDGDAKVAAICAAIEARPTYGEEDWLVIVTTDHGGSGMKHGSRVTACRETFLACSKPLDPETGLLAQ